MNKDVRLNAIIDILYHEGAVQTRDLIQRFGIADMTVRRDLDFLVHEHPEKIVRTHGGATLVKSEGLDNDLGIKIEPSYVTRLAKDASKKQEIARLALQFIKPNQFVFLDSGTTTLHMARLIFKETPCTFITTGVNIAAELLSHKCPNVILIGGEINLNTWSSRGSFSESQAGHFHADIAFMGCNAITADGNVMIGNISENGLKHKIISISNELYLLADSSKFGDYSLMTYAEVRDFNGIITDSSISQDMYERISSLSGNIITSKSNKTGE